VSPVQDKVIVTRITSGEQHTKKTCLGEYSEDEVTITCITSTPAHNESEDNGPTILQNTEDIITHLECIMLKLNYDVISIVRRVCARFRDTGNRGSSAVLKIVLKDCWPILWKKKMLFLRKHQDTDWHYFTVEERSAESAAKSTFWELQDADTSHSAMSNRTFIIQASSRETSSTRFIALWELWRGDGWEKGGFSCAQSSCV
jgi:hypothetical protein